jgi:predicted CXXCH cytochrome family protein
LFKQEELCFQCHAGLLKNIEADGTHPVFKQGKCLSCHDAHASNNTKQLVEEGGALCFNCHNDVKVGLGITKYPHKPTVEKKCIVCHRPHGSKIKGLLPRPLKSLCLSCHAEFDKDLKGKDIVIHKPVTDGDCQGCHSAHYANERGLLIAKGDKLCNTCHANQDGAKFVKAHGNISTKGADCLSCHEPHMGKDKRLLHKIMHAPFEKEECNRCHKKL